MKNLSQALIILFFFSLAGAELEGMELIDETTADAVFAGDNRTLFKWMVDDGILSTQPLQKHSYSISWRAFQEAEEKVCKTGTGTAKDWVTLGLVYRFGVPKHGLMQAPAEARSLLIKTAYEDRDISAIYHVACMVIDGEIEKHQEKITGIMLQARKLAFAGNADFLTLMLEFDHQSKHPILMKHEYRTGLRKIISSQPNARAYIALAEVMNPALYSAAILNHYKNALSMEPTNITALLGAGGVIDNGLRNGVIFAEGTETAEYYFSKAYRLDRFKAASYYGGILYERAAALPDVSESRKLFKQAEEILEEDARINFDTLLSLADYHAVNHAAKEATPKKSFDYIKQYLKYNRADPNAALEVLGNLKRTMEELGRGASKFYQDIQHLESRLKETMDLSS